MKKHFFVLLVMGIACCVYSVSPAQGFLKKAAEKAKKAVTTQPEKQPVKKEEPEPAAQKSESSSSTKSSSTDTEAVSTSRASAVTPDEHPKASTEKREYYPSLSFSTVLNGVLVQWKNGEFRLHHIQATFIENKAKGYAILRTANNTELFRFDWTAQPLKQPYTLLDINKVTDLATGEAVYGGADLKRTGDFVLDFYLPTEHFYTFPFSISKLKSKNAFAGQDWWYPSGDWDKWGYLLISDNNPEQNLTWKMWLRRRTRDDKSELHKDVTVKVEIKGSGGLVCVSRDMTRSLGPDWVRWEFDMAYPSTGNKATTWNEYFKAKHLLKKDGKYTLKVKIDGSTYGTWKFAVKGGKLQYRGRSVRATADPLRFVEGGLDAWWYESE
jgi:hypothetical protein